VSKFQVPSLKTDLELETWNLELPTVRARRLDMRSRLFVWAGLIMFTALGGIVTYSASHGQGPAESPKVLPAEVIAPPPVRPAESKVVPAAATAPAGRKATPFDRYRKYDDLPDLTREIVFSTQRGMEWLSRDGIHLPNGRFVPGWNPALGRATDDDHFMRQALGAFALARAARLTGDEKYAVRASQTVLSLLAETPSDPANPSARKPVQPAVVCNPVGAAAYLALAIYELPDAAPQLVQCGEELCQFLRGYLQTDGSVRCSEPGSSVDADGENLYPGPALAALAMSQRTSPAPWKKEALGRGLAYYRKHFQARPHPAFVPWMAVAFAETHLQTKDAACAEFVFEMCDWLRKLQYEHQDGPRAFWRGGFPTVADGKVVQTAPTIDTAYYAMGLADACRMIRQMDRPDTARYDHYRSALTRALQFLTTLQFGEENTLHFAAHFRPAVVGAFHPSHLDGNLRVDHTAVAVAALSQYLIAGADR